MTSFLMNKSPVLRNVTCTITLLQINRSWLPVVLQEKITYVEHFLYTKYYIKSILQKNMSKVSGSHFYGSPQNLN